MTMSTVFSFALDNKAWHRQFTPGAAYTNKDAATPRPLCRACVEGSMRQASTDHLRIHRAPAHTFGTQFALDAYSHSHKSLRGYKYADIFTDLTTGRMYPVFTKDRSAPELSLRVSDFFKVHPEWQARDHLTDRFVRADPERNYRSAEFLSCLTQFGYRIEPTAPRDKHANGTAESSVGIASLKCNLAMLAPETLVPQRYWDLAMTYVCITMSMNYQSRIGTSPYHLITGQHVNLKYCHAFWSKRYVHIAVKDRQGKVGFPRAYKARFVGYDFVHTLTPTYKVMQVYPNGTYGVVRNSKDVIFDTTIDFKDVNTIFPEDTTFEEYCIGPEPPLQLPQYAPPAPLLIQDIPPIQPQPALSA
jgi:hypothetical protein